MEAGDKRKPKQKETGRTKAKLGRRQSRVASEDNRTSFNQKPSSVLISKATTFETKRHELLLVLAKRLHAHMHVEHYSWASHC